MRNIFYTLLLSVALMACTSENRPVVQAGHTWSLDVEHADTLMRHAVDSIRFLALENEVFQGTSIGTHQVQRVYGAMLPLRGETVTID